MKAPDMVSYALHPGPITSKTDGDKHFITARQLAALYRVPMSQCVIVPWDSAPGREHEHLLDSIQERGLVHLYPRYNGNYALPDNGPSL